VQSPRYREDPRTHDAWVNVLTQFLASYPDVEFVDLSTCAHPEVFRDKPELFKDGGHLNAHGAEIFSTMLAEALQTSLHPILPTMNSPIKRSGQPNGSVAAKRASAP
jgi:lysophospholipase L1-like esterase